MVVAIEQNQALVAKSSPLGLVAIDSVYIMQSSKEGQKINAEVEKKINELQEFITNSQKELVKAQEDIKAKADVLSKEALQEKTEALVAKKKHIETEINNKQEALRAESQRKLLKLRDKQLALTQKTFTESNWGTALIDKNTPGLLCTLDSIDKTKEVLAIIDKDYDKALSTVAKAPSAKTEKKEIKSA